MKIREGDIIEFLAINFEDGCEFDSPTYLLEPILLYSDQGEGADGMIENICIDLISDTDLKCFYQSVEKDQYIYKLKRIAKERLSGIEKTWKTKNVHICKQKVEFYKKDEYLSFRILETINC